MQTIIGTLVLTFDKSANDLSHYAGPEPQILPVPPELVVQILGYLDKKCDKRNARLVCKGFAAAGLSSLTSKAHFSTSHIGPDYSSKIPHFSSPFLEIAMDPVLSKYITEVVCESSKLDTSYLQIQKFQNM